MVRMAVHDLVVPMAIRHGASLRPVCSSLLPKGGASNPGWLSGGTWGRIRASKEKEEAMGFKTGMLVGLGVGYVLGAKAGRERYEELKASWDQFMGNPSVQRAVSKGREAVETGTRKGIRAVEEAGGEVKDRLEGSKGTTT
jgi:hypothetical protein